MVVEVTEVVWIPLAASTADDSTHDWAGESRYDVARVARLFVWHAELAALARGTAKPPHASGDANPVVPDPEAVKETMVEK